LKFNRIKIGQTADRIEIVFLDYSYRRLSKRTYGQDKVSMENLIFDLEKFGYPISNAIKEKNKETNWFSKV